MNILVAGNGLDLHHGYKTGYVDFLIHAKRRGWQNTNAFINFFISELEADGTKLETYEKMDASERARCNKWIDCEYEIKEAVDALEKLFSLKGQVSQSEMRIRAVAKGFKKVLGDNLSSYYASLRDLNGNYNKGEYIRLLQRELNDCVEKLKEYLTEETKDERGEKIVFKTKQPFHKIICFNYTNIVNKYIEEVKKNEPTSCYWIHGSIEKNNMVLGMEDDFEDNLDYIFFKKYFQRIQKATDCYSQGDDKGMEIHSHFYGCAFGASDAEIMRDLLWYDGYKQDVNATKINHIYCNGQEDFEAKVINLISILDKKTVLSWRALGRLNFYDIKNDNRDFSEAI